MTGKVRILAAIGLALATVSPAIGQYRPAPSRAAPKLTGIDALRADFRAAAGSDTVFFGGSSAALGALLLNTTSPRSRTKCEATSVLRVSEKRDGSMPVAPMTPLLCCVRRVLNRKRSVRWAS